jgi:AraC-like DNA-binding protein
MDVLAGLLDGPRARGAFLLRSLLSPPWSVRIQDESPLSVIALVRGSAWIVHDDAEPIELTTDDVVVVRGPDPYLVADDPATPPQVLINPGQRCSTISGDAVPMGLDLGVRTWGNDADGPTVMLSGTYEEAGAIGQRLLNTLPRLVHLPASSSAAPLVHLLAAEVGKDEPGQEAVLDRLLDLLLIGTLRSWFARPDADTPGWFRAHADPVVGRALRLLQNDPARGWTVADLAGEVGMSRAALARRFTDLVGEPPMAFLTEWRLTLAADLLLEPDATVAGVAQQVGYGTPFALSAAFKRVRGVSPQEHRVAVAAAAPPIPTVL